MPAMLVCTDITWSIAAWQVVGDDPLPGAPVGCAEM